MKRVMFGVLGFLVPASLGWVIGGALIYWWYLPYIAMKDQYTGLERYSIETMRLEDASLEDVKTGIKGELERQGCSIGVGYIPDEIRKKKVRLYLQTGHDGLGFINNTCAIFGVRWAIFDKGRLVVCSD